MIFNQIYLIILNYRQLYHFQSPANEGRRDFREVIGVDQLKILLPLLAELGHAQNKRLKELELYKAVKVRI